ncbi:ATP-binding protein [Thermosipho ferrireducens]|uniref:ATP-binding protein n=1 Tax=Thermosipho ferrireducens TaxID=2571116 RepID=A0ABX7S9A2_9BACT|nr:AAA family ATPase [Thermosipho ferrireducens]QTA38466.1 ATP-binding protein [Thermosipho ferrireducens]
MDIIPELVGIQTNIAKKVPLKFKRYLYKKINWDYNVITIMGARGTGKTTMVLQYYIENINRPDKMLYISADNPLVLREGLYDIAMEYFKYGGESLIIDEVHKYPDWSLQIKAICDAYPDKKLIILGSSKLEISTQKGDLSRRTLVYNLHPLSFREYLEIITEEKFEKITLEDLLNNHVYFASKLTKKVKNILLHFKNFLRFGCFPFFIGLKEEDYHSLTRNILDKVIYEDIPSLKILKSETILPLKKLIAFIADSNIPTFSVSSITKELGVSKETVYELFELLQKADILRIIRTKRASLRSIKNAKIFFLSPNFYYAIMKERWIRNPKPGNIRESFFVSQLESKKLYIPPSGDFLVEDNKKEYIFEIGGKSKGKKQISNLENAYILRDNIEIGFGNIIPLYLIGFLY